MASQVCCSSLLPALETAENSATSREEVLSNTGCKWTGRFVDAEKHFNECEYVEVACSFVGCSAVMPRREAAEHLSQCNHRTVACKLCGRRMKAMALEQHGSACPMRLVKCHSCSAAVAFDALASHKATVCPEEMIPCTYAQAGCHDRMRRKDLEHHLDSSGRQHSQLLWASMQALQPKARDYDSLRLSTARLMRKYDALRKDYTALWQVNATLSQELEDYETVTLHVDHRELRRGGDFSLYSEYRMVGENWFTMSLVTYDPDSEYQDYYGLYLGVDGGPFPCTVHFTIKLMHHDAKRPTSAIEWNDEHTYTYAHEGCGFRKFVSKADLADPDNNSCVSHGYVTFQCTFKIVAEDG